MKGLDSLVMRAALFGASLSLVAASEVRVSAQRGARPSSVERRIEQLNRQSEQLERDRLGRELKGAPEGPSDRRKSQAMEAQVKHDLEHLQESYNRIVLAMKAKQGLDHDSLMGAVAEVHKCATRLRDNLALPRPKADEDQKGRGESEPARVEESLLTLRKHVYDFLTNPLFEAPLALDVEQAGKASRDLDRIIELSAGLSKGGDKHKKTASH